MPTVFITSGTTYVIPTDFGELVSIECIGGGGMGGGGYSKTINGVTLTSGASVTIQVGAGAPFTGTDTWFNGASLAASSCGAKGGGNPNGGAAASGVTVGTGGTKFSGGNGGTTGGASQGRGGGGGAAGPNGNGGAGGNFTGSTGGGGGGNGGGTAGVSSSTAPHGGDNSGGTGHGTGGGSPTAGTNGGGGGGVTATGSPAGNGGAGTEWDATHGSGGGGGGGGWNGSSGGAGGNGALYGGGGGGSALSVGPGANGLIVFTYIVASPLKAAGAAIAAILSLAAAPQWPYQFQGSSQPYAQPQLNPTALDVAVNDPPFRHPGRTLAQTAIAVQSTQPDPWNYAPEGNLGPYMPRQISPGISGVLADNPPFGIPPKWLSGITQAWQPDIWPAFFIGGSQPYAPRRLPIVVTNYVPDNPPFASGGREPTTEPSERGWQPDVWPPIFMGGSQPYAARRLPISVTNNPPDNPPVVHPSRWVGFSAITQQWQPDPWPPAFGGGSQPYSPRRLTPSLTRIQVDNPPFQNLGRWSGQVSIEWQSLPADWPVLFIGSAQPYAPKRLNPVITAVQVDDPPFLDTGRNVEQTAIELALSQPDPWTYNFMGGLGPFLPRKLQPGTPGSSVDNPPFRMAGRLPQTTSTQWQWQPEVWPYAFMGARQPYQRGSLPPQITAVPEKVNYRLTIRNQIVRLDNVIKSSGNVTNFKGYT